jgi:predicted NBD/HSP70 family sugar kinase
MSQEAGDHRLATVGGKAVVRSEDVVAGRSKSAWNRGRLRSNNERLLLDQLRAAGPTSRAQLARDTGLSKPTVSHALAALDCGLVSTAWSRARPGKIVAERGRTALLYEPDPTAGYVLGIDIGRARLRAAVADLSGEILARTDVPNRERTATGVADAAAQAAEQALDAGRHPRRAGHPRGRRHPGRLRPRGRPRAPGREPAGWGRAGLFARIRERLGEPGLSVHNDANLAALGEYDLGAGRGSRLFVYVLIGTGLGVGIVSEGELFTGAHGAAGEVGFLPASFTAPGSESAPQPPLETTDAHRRGMLEEAVSADAVVRAAKERGLRVGSRRSCVFEQARAGHPAAVGAVRQEGERIAHVVAAISAVLDPDVVVLGGGVGHGADLMLDPVRDDAAQDDPAAPDRRGERAGRRRGPARRIDDGIARGAAEVFDRRSGRS